MCAVCVRKSLGLDRNKEDSYAHWRRYFGRVSGNRHVACELPVAATLIEQFIIRGRMRQGMVLNALYPMPISFRRIRVLRPLGRALLRPGQGARRLPGGNFGGSRRSA